MKKTLAACAAVAFGTVAFLAVGMGAVMVSLSSVLTGDAAVGA
jgi:hypothetical protein